MKTLFRSLFTFPITLVAVSTITLLLQSQSAFAADADDFAYYGDAPNSTSTDFPDPDAFELLYPLTYTTGSGHLDEPEGDSSDMYKVTVPAEDHVRIQVGINGSDTVYWEVYSSDGTQISSTFTLDSTHYYNDYPAPEDVNSDQTYYIRIHLNSGDANTYQIYLYWNE